MSCPSTNPTQLIYDHNFAYQKVKLRKDGQFLNGCWQISLPVILQDVGRVGVVVQLDEQVSVLVVFFLVLLYLEMDSGFPSTAFQVEFHAKMIDSILRVQ